MLFSQVLFFLLLIYLSKKFCFLKKKKKKSISGTVKINRNKLTLAFSVTFKFFDSWLIIFLKWFHKVCIIRLVHICFEKSSSTFWQVRCCVHRTRRSCQKYDEDFFKFCGLLRKPKFYYYLFLPLGNSNLIDKDHFGIRYYLFGTP